MKEKIIWIIPGKEEEHTSMIFSKRQIGSLISAGIEGKAFHLRSRTSPIEIWFEINRLKKLILNYKPNLIHSHYGSITGVVSAVSGKLPLIITFQGSDLNKTPSDGRVRDFLGRKASSYAASKATKIICVSQKLTKNLARKHLVKTEVIPFGINTEAFKPLHQNEAREMLGWKKEDKVILFNANNPNIKRLDIALECIKKIRASVPEARLEILQGNIEPDRVPLFINASDVLLLCSDSEGSPMIIKESLACNLPIVANAVGDVAERIEDVDGCYISSQNVESLSVRLIEVLHNNKRTNGREILFRDGLTEEDITNKVINLYETVLK